MAATLHILRQQGLLQTATTEKMDREQTQISRDAWLAEYRHRLAQRELDRLRSRNASNSKDQAQREWENRQREAAEARESMELFANYRPDVEIKYHDEDGRVLTTKEAWKALSHKFHGKGSGRMKTEKRLKRIAEEKKRDAMSSGDTPLSMQAAFQIRQERAGQAHMVLSVGNRGCVLSSRHCFFVEAYTTVLLVLCLKRPNSSTLLSQRRAARPGRKTSQRKNKFPISPALPRTHLCPCSVLTLWFLFRPVHQER